MIGRNTEFCVVVIFSHQVVESGSKSMEIGIMRAGKSLELIDESLIAPIVASMEAEAEAESKRAAADD